MPCPALHCVADEWTNYLERVGMGEKEMEVCIRTKKELRHLRMWATFRGQTLARTGKQGAREEGISETEGKEHNSSVRLNRQRRRMASCTALASR